MSRILQRLTGTGSGGEFASGDLFKLTPHANPLKYDLDLLMLGILQQNIPAGGSTTQGIPVSADGDVDVLDWTPPVRIDNTASQFSSFTDANSATLVAQFRFALKVSSALISVTPKLLYGAAISTVSTVATISGAVACSATNDDFVSGANQYQTVAVTLPGGVTLWKAQLTVAGTGGSPYTVWGRVTCDLYVQSS